MKVSYVMEAVQRDGQLVLACDVSRDEVKMAWRVRVEGRGVAGFEVCSDACGNDTESLEAKLEEVAVFATSRGYAGLLVVAEPTGGYEQLLLRTAQRLGHLAAYVSGEAVSKSRAIEFNDDGKTDERDPLVIAW